MKHIRKYNEASKEAKSYEIDKEYIDSVFAEFLDDDENESVMEEFEKNNIPYYTIFINRTNLPKEGLQDIKKLMKLSNDMKLFYNDIDICIQRVKDELKDIHYFVYLEEFDHSGQMDIFTVQVCFSMDEKTLNEI